MRSILRGIALMALLAVTITASHSVVAPDQAMAEATTVTTVTLRGRVMDGNGPAAAGIEVRQVNMERHVMVTAEQAQAFKHYHTRTDAAGRYVLRSSYPSLRFMRAEKEGYAEQEIPETGEGALAPGKYDFIVKRLQ